MGISEGEKVYAGMVVTAATALIAKMITNSVCDWVFIISFLLWLFLLMRLVYLTFSEGVAKNIISSLGFLLCILATLWFMSAVLRMPPDAIPTYIPISADIGIFVGLGSWEAWNSIQSPIHQYPGAVIGGIQTVFHFFGAKIRNLLELVVARLPQRLAQEQEPQLV